MGNQLTNLQRVTLVTETYYPEVNGVANTLHHWVNGLNAQGIAVQIIRPRQSKAIDGDHNNNANSDNANELLNTILVNGLPIPGYSELRFGLPNKMRVEKAVKEFKPQVIYIATEGLLGLTAVKIAKHLRIATVSGFHTNFDQFMQHYKLGWLAPLVERYLRYFHNQTQTTLVPTRAQCLSLRQQGFNNVTPLARGVDSHLFNPIERSDALRASWGVNEDDLVLMVVGRIAAEKNIELAIRTCQRIHAQFSHIKLVIVGDGPELKILRKQHPDVIFCGQKSGRQLARHYASADIFLFPSKTDTFGNVVLEALASGLPVISFDYAAANEHVLHRNNGMLATCGDEQEFYDGVETLARYPNLIPKMRRQARAEALRVNWEKITAEFIDYLNNASTGEKLYRIEKETIFQKKPAI